MSYPQYPHEQNSDGKTSEENAYPTVPFPLPSTYAAPPPDIPGKIPYVPGSYPQMPPLPPPYSQPYPYPEQSYYPSAVHDMYSAPLHASYLESASGQCPYSNPCPTTSYQPPETEETQKNYTPTVFPAESFDSVKDSEILRKAMKGLGTDEKALINVLARRTRNQRLEIAEQFEITYGKDLLKNLKSETSGTFKDVLKAMMKPLPELYSDNLHDALEDEEGETDEDTLIEIFCTKSNDEIKAIREEYENEYECALEDDLNTCTFGTFRYLMTTMSKGFRNEDPRTNVQAAKIDANRLLTAGPNPRGVDESTLSTLICERSYAQLQVIFDEYGKARGRDIEDVILEDYPEDTSSIYVGILNAIRDPPYFFAKCLHDALPEGDVDNRKLIRIVVTRCETDMGDIKNIFEGEYEKSLADAISNETSGYYKKCLLALIGEY